MKTKRTPKAAAARRSLGEGGFFNVRALTTLLICGAAAWSIVSGALLAFVRPDASAKVSQRTLTFAERVAYQRAIEEVYWRHRIWPTSRPDRKPSSDAVMSQAQLEKKVADYLRKSQALDDYWQRPITAEQLQAETDRMAKHTKQPPILREVFEALGNDPFVIAECVARPALVDRLLRNWYAYDERIHGELKKRAAAELQTHPAVEQMKELSGTYSEMELIKSDTAPWTESGAPEHGIRLNSGEWEQAVRRLAAVFGSEENETDPIRALKIGVVSRLQEDETRYYATAVIEKTDKGLKLASVSWAKDPLESWLSRMENQLPSTSATTDTGYALPKISDGAGCIDDTWTATAGPPDSRFGHTAVWTGSEMVIWGGYDGTNDFNTGYKYNPATDTWTATSTVNAPAAREYHTAIWTGSLMIVWGGSVHDSSYPNTGGRYDPSTDTWVATSTANAPTGRYGHSEVWTGTEMIVWGGYDGNPSDLNTGGRYNPVTDTWIATSTTNAPIARDSHTAVWAGNRMIVWGGYSFGELNSGGRYNPSTDSWSPTSLVDAPDARDYHTAISTGSEMIIWGGHSNEVGEFNTGARYDPGSDTWIPTSTANAPSARASHTATWTGSEMIVWGATVDSSGGRYNPTTDSWIATSTINAPTARGGHTAVWTGNEIIVWGGGGQGPYNLNTGGRYNPSTDTWVPTNTYNVPAARHSHTAVWTGTEMIIWGGLTLTYWNNGETYNSVTDDWSAISITNAPSARAGHTTVWTGTEMIIWGGVSQSGNLNTGGRYSPDKDSWTAISTTNAPTARSSHTAVWTGTEMIVWGGAPSFLNTGGRYNPSTDNWTATSTTNAPTARNAHTAVWTDSEMIIWGGIGTPCNPSCLSLNTGGKYNPSADSWIATSIVNPPAGRGHHTAVWTGSEMIIWGGRDFSNNRFNTGGRLNPGTNSWIPTNTSNAPIARDSHTAVWTGTEMIVWGGIPTFLNTGGRYNRNADTWSPTNTTAAPVGREAHTAVWTGTEMIVWGGYNDPGSDLNTGGRYCAQSGPTPTPTTTPIATPTTTASATPTATPSATPSATPTATSTATATPTPTSTPTPTIRPACTLDGTLGTAPPGGGSGMLATRIFRFGTPLVMCGVSPLWPGNSGEGPYIYNVHYITNSGGTPLCTRVNLHYVSGGIPTVDLQLSAFMAPFAPDDISNSARYLGDAGVSTGSPPVDTSFQLTVPGFTTIALVVFNVNAAPTGEGAVYQVIVDQDIYCAGVSPTPTSTATVTPTATPSTTATATPTAIATATATATAMSTITPSVTPTATPTARPTLTPRPNPTPRTRPTPPPRP